MVWSYWTKVNVSHCVRLFVNGGKLEENNMSLLSESDNGGKSYLEFTPVTFFSRFPLSKSGKLLDLYWDVSRRHGIITVYFTLTFL